MLFNYVKIAFRNLSRNKVYSLINISGLSLGVACCLLLSLYIQDEVSYDQHQKDLDDLYNVVTEIEGGFRDHTASPPIALTMRDEIPEIEYAARILNPPGVVLNLIKYEDKLFYETNGFIADSSVFDILTYDMLQGNPKNALVETNSVVISEALSNKLFFNDGEALDKIISISQGDESNNFKVTGVFREIGKSHLTANFFTSMTSSGFANILRTDPYLANQWAGENFIPSYFKLRHGTDKAVVEKKMNEVLKKYGAKDMAIMGRAKTLSLEAVKDIHLRSNLDGNPRIIYLYVIGSIALFILVLACINFMNLSTAKATKRASEIGIRKVMGAVKSSLVAQILGEAMVIVFISILMSVIMVQIGLPFFNDLTGKSISYDTDNIAFFIIALIVISIVTGLIAGSYPAFYLSSFQPAEVLKGKFKMSNASGLLRRSLVVFQFMIAITLVCGMMIISKQLDFMQQENLGFNSQAKIVLPLRTDAARQAYDGLQKELQKESTIKSVSGTEYPPGSNIFSDSFFYPDGGNMETAIDIRQNNVCDGYIELLGIRLLTGRSFSENEEPDSGRNIVINKIAAEQLGFTAQEAIGRKIYTEMGGRKRAVTIIGVMDNYHQMSLQEKINPILFKKAFYPDQIGRIVLDVNTERFDKTIHVIENIWKSQISDVPFEYTFLDDNIQKQYYEDQKVSRIISIFTVIAMLISCLGLYGLSSYMAERRFKEIGVRKIMGASIGQIVAMMSTEFIKLVLIAFIISVPLAWIVMNRWLDGFAYKISIDGLIFVYAGTAALMVALITVSFESIKAAITNPVESLRNE